MEKALSGRELRFIDCYEQTWNGTRAALMAGYGNGTNEKTAANAASRLMKDPRVRDEIDRRRRAEFEALNINRETLTGRLAEIVSRCMEGKEHLSWNSDTKSWEPDGTWVMDTNGAIKALKLLGDSVGMFETKVAVSGVMGVEQYLKSLGESGTEF